MSRISGEGIQPIDTETPIENWDNAFPAMLLVTTNSYHEQ